MLTCTVSGVTWANTVHTMTVAELRMHAYVTSKRRGKVASTALSLAHIMFLWWLTQHLPDIDMTF